MGAWMCTGPRNGSPQMKKDYLGMVPGAEAHSRQCNKN